MSAGNFCYVEICIICPLSNCYSLIRFKYLFGCIDCIYYATLKVFWIIVTLVICLIVTHACPSLYGPAGEIKFIYLNRVWAYQYYSWTYRQPYFVVKRVQGVNLGFKCRKIRCNITKSWLCTKNKRVSSPTISVSPQQQQTSALRALTNNKCWFYTNSKHQWSVQCNHRNFQGISSVTT